MKYLVTLGLLALISQINAFYGPGYGMAVDYPGMLPAPQYGPRFRFQKEEPEPKFRNNDGAFFEPPSRRRFFKEEPLSICPISLEGAECASECERDNDCGELQFCCRSGCSTACFDMDLTDKRGNKTQIEELDKREGEEVSQFTLECPKYNPNLNCTSMKEMCSTDSDCEPDQKCCRIRCSMRCIGPRPKQGRRRIEGRRNRPVGNGRMRGSRIESLYPKNDNIMLSNSRSIFPNSYFSSHGDYYPRFNMNW